MALSVAWLGGETEETKRKSGQAGIYAVFIVGFGLSFGGGLMVQSGMNFEI